MLRVGFDIGNRKKPYLQIVLIEAHMIGNPHILTNRDASFGKNGSAHECVRVLVFMHAWKELYLPVLMPFLQLACFLWWVESLWRPYLRWRYEDQFLCLSCWPKSVFPNGDQQRDFLCRPRYTKHSRPMILSLTRRQLVQLASLQTPTIRLYSFQHRQ